MEVTPQTRKEGPLQQRTGVGSAVGDRGPGRPGCAVLTPFLLQPRPPVLAWHPPAPCPSPVSCAERRRLDTETRRAPHLHVGSLSSRCCSHPNPALCTKRGRDANATLDDVRHASNAPLTGGSHGNAHGGNVWWPHRCTMTDGAAGGLTGGLEDTSRP